MIKNATRKILVDAGSEKHVAFGQSAKQQNVPGYLKLVVPITY